MENRYHATNSATIISQPDWPQTESPSEAAEVHSEGSHHLASYVPSEIGHIGRDHQTALPRIAKDPHLTRLIDQALRQVPTRHEIYPGDARRMDFLRPESVHLVVCSPPYWTLKEYRDTEGQLGHISDYEGFLAELDRVWSHCYRALVPGGRLIIVVGDVCLSRRREHAR